MKFALFFYKSSYQNHELQNAITFEQKLISVQLLSHFEIRDFGRIWLKYRKFQFWDTLDKFEVVCQSLLKLTEICTIFTLYYKSSILWHYLHEEILKMTKKYFVRAPFCSLTLYKKDLIDSVPRS